MIKIYETGTLKDGEIFDRSTETADVSDTVAEIIAEVRRNGDRALFAYAEKFDHAVLNNLQVTQQEIDDALQKVEKEFIRILEDARNNIEAFHRHQVRSSFVTADKEGVLLGQRVIPLEKVGIYVPGGTAAYPSTVLMDAVPAKIAGVKEIIMVTPPSRDGSINPYILAAAHIAGVSRIFRTGGAQAVAA
ncbi:MAG: histidinol dehydrogenase, partial [Solobacterium sp.]|nr:histidinol dehydrogenase [Solobacterium sp.]